MLSEWHLNLFTHLEKYKTQNPGSKMPKKTHYIITRAVTIVRNEPSALALHSSFKFPSVPPPPGNSPVDDFVLVQVLEAEHDTGGVEDGPRLGEHVRVDVHHQVTAGRVLHHKTHVTLSGEEVLHHKTHVTLSGEEVLHHKTHGTLSGEEVLHHKTHVTLSGEEVFHSITKHT